MLGQLPEPEQEKAGMWWARQQATLSRRPYCVCHAIASAEAASATLLRRSTGMRAIPELMKARGGDAHAGRAV